MLRTITGCILVFAAMALLQEVSFTMPGSMGTAAKPGLRSRAFQRPAESSNQFAESTNQGFSASSVLSLAAAFGLILGLVGAPNAASAAVKAEEREKEMINVVDASDDAARKAKEKEMNAQLFANAKKSRKEVVKARMESYKLKAEKELETADFQGAEMKK
eukprot:TRINITY_DN12921_c2_g1_i1.p1 TRINITY_DN12921_c2_g1~~TRINITY_DN12921_c2_g1_i1.p1  ORF type:complete len:161 (+),score=41.22 TRINITY_DN12921_c2_g1_i1:62-544(+)